MLLGLGVEGDEGQKRQIAPRVVVAVEQSKLLTAVRRILGRVEIDRDPLRPSRSPPLAVLIDLRRGARVAGVIVSSLDYLLL